PRPSPLPYTTLFRSEGRTREPAPHDLPQAGQVGRDAEELLGPAAGDPKAGDHLVEDQKSAGGVARLAKSLQEPLRRRHHPHVRGDRKSTRLNSSHVK